jgi:hypothetical protein
MKDRFDPLIKKSMESMTLQAYTLLEVTTAMVLSSILVFMLFLSFNNMERYANRLKEDILSRSSATWNLLQLELDFLSADVVIASDNQLTFKNADGEAKYYFENLSEQPSLVCRQQGHVRDSIPIPIAIKSLDFRSSDSLVTRVHFDFAGSELVFVKQYQALYRIPILNHDK